MTSYNKSSYNKSSYNKSSYNESSTQSQPLSKESSLKEDFRQEDLTLVRKGLTRQPQNTLADFKLRSTGYSLEIQFSQHRLRECPLFTAKKKKAEESGLSLLMIAMTTLLVGGSVALTRSAIFGVFVAIAIPLFWRLAQPSKVHSPIQTATLRFVNTPQHQTFLSLTTEPTPPAISRYKAPLPHLPSPVQNGSAATIHFSNLPIKMVSASTYLVGGQLSLTLYTSDAHGKNRLRITGTRQEVQWLHARVEQWAKATLPHPITQG